MRASRYEVVVEQGHQARCLYILMRGSLTAQRIDVRLQTWNVETRILCVLLFAFAPARIIYFI